MKKLILKSFLLAFAITVMTSCNTDSSDVVSDQNLGYCLTVSKDVDTRAQNVNRMSFSAQYNYTGNTVDLTVVGVELPKAGSSTGLRFPKMTFSGLAWQYNQSAWKVTEVEDVKPVINGMSEVPTFKKLKFMLLDAFNDGSYSPGIMYEFEVEHDGSVVEIVGCCMAGKTVSKAGDMSYVPEEDSSLASNKKPIYWVDFDFKNSKADIYIFNAKFLGGMPSLNMTFEGVDMSIANGVVTLSSDGLTPMCEGVPFPSFPITGLKGTVDYTEGMKLEFHCDFRGTDYTVNFDGKY